MNWFHFLCNTQYPLLIGIRCKIIRRRAVIMNSVFFNCIIRFMDFNFMISSIHMPKITFYDYRWHKKSTTIRSLISINIFGIDFYERIKFILWWRWYIKTESHLYFLITKLLFLIWRKILAVGCLINSKYNMWLSMKEGTW